MVNIILDFLDSTIHFADELFGFIWKDRKIENHHMFANNILLNGKRIDALTLFLMFKIDKNIIDVVLDLRNLPLIVGVVQLFIFYDSIKCLIIVDAKCRLDR